MEHWSEQKEKAVPWQIRFFFILIKIFPSFFLKILAFPVGFFYFLFAKKARSASRLFLDRAAFRGKKLSALRNFTAFALTLVEKVDAWTGRISFDRVHLQEDDADTLTKGLEAGKGAVLLCSHLGNMELLRALADYRRTGVSREIPVVSVADFNTTPFFNSMIKSLNPRSHLSIVSANEVGPETIFSLEEQINAGGLVVIAGDRTSANTRDRIFSIPFLGSEAPFPQGAYLLALLLNAPVYAVFGLRRRDLSIVPEYNMHIRLIDDARQPPHSRAERRRRMEYCAGRFAALLEGYCLQYPHQWYNFFDFWAGGIKPDGPPQHNG
jgi:predicted LPLAT superfamily acyltransferase